MSCFAILSGVVLSRVSPPCTVLVQNQDLPSTYSQLLHHFLPLTTGLLFSPFSSLTAGLVFMYISPLSTSLSVIPRYVLPVGTQLRSSLLVCYFGDAWSLGNALVVQASLAVHWPWYRTLFSFSSPPGNSTTFHHHYFSVLHHYTIFRAVMVINNTICPSSDGT